MSASSKKTRRQLRRGWITFNQGQDQPLSFVAYKHGINWAPTIQKGWDTDKGTQSPHQQRN